MTDQGGRGPEVVLLAGGLARALVPLTLLVAAAGVAVEVLKEQLRLGAESSLVAAFSLSHEWNVPTLYTASLLAGCALALAVIAVSARQTGEPFVGHWRLLAVGFAYIGVDEALGIHEHAGALVKLEHLVYFDWIVPATGLLAILGLVYFPFLRALTAGDRSRFLLAGVIYVGGAVGMELPLGWWTSRHGIDNLGYALIDAVEETLEMVGLVLFLHSLLRYLASRRVSVRFDALARTPSAEGDGGPSVAAPLGATSET